MSIPQLLVHEEADNVAVAVVEDLKANTEALCVNTSDNSDFKITVLHDIPIGHKIALQDIDNEGTAIKYGEDIGKFIAPVKRGEWVHIHNLKTKRW